MIEINERIRLLLSHENIDHLLRSQQAVEDPLEANACRFLDSFDLCHGGCLGRAVNRNAADTELRLWALFEGQCRTAKCQHQTGHRQQGDYGSAAEWDYTHGIQAL